MHHRASSAPTFRQGASRPTAPRAHPFGVLATALTGMSALAAAWHFAPNRSAGGNLRAPLERLQLWSTLVRLVGWLAQAPRTTVALEVLRGGLWLLGVYLCTTAVLLALARLDPTGWASRLAEAWTPMKLRQIAGMGTLALAGAVGTVPVVRPVPPGLGAVATIRALPLPRTSELGSAPEVRPRKTVPPAPATRPVHEASPVRAPSPTPTARGTSRWVVQPGQSFWSEAEALASGSEGLRSPDERTRQIATCWLELERLDQDRLVRPGDFDLIEPGQVMKRPRADRCGED